jgi:FkbM family methyltransferase
MSPSPLRLRLARLRALVWRFHTLPLAHRLFAARGGPQILRRRLFGFELAVDVSRGNPQRLLFLEGERFLAERGLIQSLLGPGLHAVDVGANIGYYLLLLARAVGPGGTVTCFEPDPDNLEELHRNATINELANVSILPAAVGAEDSTAALTPGINSSVSTDGEIQVPLVRLDSCLDLPVGFLKIDVEGYEGHVLAGAERILREDRPTLFLEIHPGFLSPPYTVDGLLDGLRGLYGQVKLYEIAPQESLADKLRARYLGRGVRAVPDPVALLADCHAGRRKEPFWAVCHRP